MKKLYSLLFLFLNLMVYSQASITALNVAYNENFDEMTATGTTFPAHWTAVRASGSGTANETLTLIASNGSNNTGTVHNVGTTAAADRALGSLASNTTVPAFGMSFINNTGDQITEFNISLVVEQWRTGSSATANEVMSFSYSTNATSLINGDWTNATTLNINEILTSTTAAAAVDGNATGNNANLNATINISSSPWANGATLWIKWTDDNAAGNDCMLAIDDFSFRATSNILSSSSFDGINGLKMYPNPLKGNTLFLTSNANANMSIEIYDVLGKEVLKSNLSNNAVNVSGLNAGVYIVKITEEGKTATRKLVIQ
jgi:hypothetical protein